MSANAWRRRRVRKHVLRMLNDFGIITWQQRILLDETFNRKQLEAWLAQGRPMS